MSRAHSIATLQVLLFGTAQFGATGRTDVSTATSARRASRPAPTPTPKWRSRPLAAAAPFVTAIVVLIGGCGGGGIFDPDPPAADDFLNAAAQLYSTQPDIGNCEAGALTDAERQKALDTLNDIRKLHGLGLVTYDYSSDQQVMLASLMMSANGALSHEPPQTWKCYSAAGAQGAGTSNLTGGPPSANLEFSTTEENVVGWLTDIDNLIPNNIGHRRWLLDPFLKTIAYGRVAGAYDSGRVADSSAIKVIDSSTPTNGKASGEYVAYPVGDYPAKYFVSGALLSFSAIASLATEQANASVDFSAALIFVTQRGAGPLVVKNIAFDNVGYGLPNCIQFAAEGIASNVVYDVSIRGVKVGGVGRDYSYWFRVVQ